MKDPAQRSDSEAEAIGSRGPPCYVVQVLGPFAIYRDGISLDTASWQRRSLTLLKLLVTSPDRRRLRDELIDLLWPDADPEAGARNLRYVLHILRRDLGGGEPSPVESHRDWIGLSPLSDWQIDLLEAEKQAAAADGDIGSLERIVDLHRGEPLAEDRYEDWAAPVRERAKHLWRTAVLRLARSYSESGNWDAAARSAERLLTEDSVDEEALQELLRALEGADWRPDAIRRFQEFEQLLEREIGVPPSKGTLSIVERLRSQPRAPGEVPEQDSITALIDVAKRPPPSGGFLGALPVSPIVARDDELERLAIAAEVVQAGNGRLLALVGEAGVGKTRLAQEAMLRLSDAGFLVLTGRCFDRDPVPIVHPFLEVMVQACASMPAIDLTEALRSRPDLAQFLVNQTATDPGEARARLGREVTSLLVTTTAAQPLAILLDDVQWADEASLGLLQQIARQTRNQPVLLLIAYREAEVDREHPLWQTIRDLDREGLLERIAIRRLTEEGTAALVSTTIGEIEGGEEFVEFVHRRTKGNPFYVHKMVRALGGHYQLVRQIGAGGMGRVFQAVDTRTGEPVAAKIMFARTEADPRALQRFEQEGALLASLTHPNIVEVRGTFLEERASCIVMELLVGRSLGEILRSIREEGYPTLSLSRLKNLMTQVVAALKCAHDRSIIHRDIKPDNIMVIDRDRVKVTDFGIARMIRPIEAVSTMTSTGMTMGTPLYMAPEQIEGMQVDGRADIYSLGCVLYEAVAGRPPFEADDPLSVAISHVRDLPKPPREVNPELPDDWNGLILKMLAKDPKDRLQSAGALSKALYGLSEGERAPETSRRSFPLPTSLLTATAVLIVGALAFGFWSHATSNTKAATLGRLEGNWTLPISSPALLKKPSGLAGDGRGGFFVLDAGANRVRHLSSTGRLLASWGSLGSGPGQMRDPQSLAVDSSRNVYVADSGNDRVEKFSSAGRLLNTWGSSGSGTGQLRFPDGIALDRSGFIYISDWGNNRIVVLRPSGRPKVTSVGTFTALYAGLNHPTGLAVDRKGQLFVESGGDHQIVEFSPDGIIQLGAWPTSHDPTGMALDSAGNVYVTDPQGSTVESFSSFGTPLNTWSLAGQAHDQPMRPDGIMVDGRNILYLSDSANGAVLRLSSSRRWVPAFNLSSVASVAKSPDSIAVDMQGDMYVGDSSKNTILELSPSGRLLQGHELSRNGLRVTAGSQGVTFVGPIGGMTVNAHGNVFLTDYGSGSVLKLSPFGEILETWGSTGSGPALTNPQGIAAFGGNVYVADQGNSRVQIFSSTGAFKTLSRIAGATGSEPYLYGVAVDQSGFVYLTDDLHDHIVKLSPKLRVLNQWGGRGSGSGELRAPQGIAVNSTTDTVYVADTGNNRIQLFSTSGKALGAAATRFKRPEAVAVDRHGNVYVADTGAGRIEKFAP